ncbi:hypothetical protein YC2023_099063 [Brassica napus]
MWPIHKNMEAPIGDVANPQEYGEMWPIHKNMEAPIGDVANPQEYGGLKGVIGSSRTAKLCRDLERLGNPSRQASLFLFSLLLSHLSFSLSLSLSFLFLLDLFRSPRRESPKSKPSHRWRWWSSSKWWWGDRPSVVMVVAVWCCGGDQISSLLFTCSSSVQISSPLSLVPDPDPVLG